MRANTENEDFFCRLVEDGSLLIQQDGTVLNTKTLKVYSYQSKKGHIHIAWKDNRRTLHILAHRLVYRTKRGPLGPDDQVIHLDGDHSNNRPANLLKTNNAGSMKHAYDLGRIDTNEIRNRLRNYYRDNLQVNAKLSADEVVRITQSFAAGDTIAALADEFKTNRKTISWIVRGMSYRPTTRSLATGEQPK